MIKKLGQIIQRLSDTKAVQQWLALNKSLNRIFSQYHEPLTNKFGEKTKDPPSPGSSIHVHLWSNCLSHIRMIKKNFKFFWELFSSYLVTYIKFQPTAGLLPQGRSVLPSIANLCSSFLFLLLVIEPNYLRTKFQKNYELITFWKNGLSNQNCFWSVLIRSFALARIVSSFIISSISSPSIILKSLFLWSAWNNLNNLEFLHKLGFIHFSWRFLS